MVALLDDLPARHFETGEPIRPHRGQIGAVEKDHGRIEMRRFALSTPLDGLEPRAEWEGLKAVGRVEVVRMIRG